jgi:hypothetical protein
MKTVLSVVLLALVASMIVAPAFADSKLESLVNLATQARSQIKVQLDKQPSVSDEVRTLYEQGNRETESLISAAKQGNVAQAKQSFMAAMRTFKQISLTFSETTQPEITLKMTPPPQTASVPEFDYGNAIKRIEAYTNTLKGLTVKNNLIVDFTRIDSLIQLSKSNLANGDIPALEKTFSELKTAITETQSAIKEMTTQRANDRARSFANSYITKIDAILSQAKELGLSDEDIAKLNNAKEEILSANDPSRIIIIVKRYSINLNPGELQRQAQPVPEKAATEEKRPAPETTEEKKAPEKVETEEKRPAAEAAPAEKPAADSREERAKQREATKNQRIADELARIESRVAELQPHVDENIKPKLERAESLLAKLKNQETTSNSDYKRTVKMLNLLLDQMEQYIRSLQTENTNADRGEEVRNQEPEEKRSSKQD